MQYIPWRRFQTCVQRYRGDYKIKDFTCADHFRVLAFAQLTYRESLRDIETYLRAMRSKLYHMGLGSTVSCNNLSHTNETRDWRIYADFARMLIAQARNLYLHDDLGIDLSPTVYALDSTTIDLCLSLFPWARFRKAKGAVKLHTLLNLRGSIPEFLHVSHGPFHDVNILDILLPIPGAFYVMDRAYLDFGRLCLLDQAGAFFVTRPKKRFNFRRRYSHPVDRSTGLVCDRTILSTTFYPAQRYPQPLRRIRCFDVDRQQRLIFLTKNFDLDALTITRLYKARWQIELFFKWIKQHLRIKAFYGISPNAVTTQIWAAIATYLLVAVLKKRLDIEHSLYTILQILSVSIFEQIPITEVFTRGN